MCGRTSLAVPPGTLAGRFGVDVPERYRPRYNIAPRDDLAVVRNDAREELCLHRWGLVPSWADEGHEGFINARAETVEEKPSFREAAAERRCLVLADGFYEWQQRTTGKQPFRVERADDEPFAMAGLYEPGEESTTAGTDGAREESTTAGTDGAREEGSPTTVTVLTTEPNEVVAPLHDRMAVVLEPDEEDAWLDADDPAERAALLDTPDPDPFHAYPVSDRINDPAAEGPELAEPVDAPDEDPQTGLGDFS